MGTKSKMKTKLIIILLVFISFNFGSGKPSQAEPKQTIQHQLDLKQELYRQKQIKKYPKVLDYLTTRVHRTSYIFSGSTPKGWDCSGLVRWTYQQIGITLPHSADQQGHLGKRVSIPKRGDIVVFAYQGRTDFYHAAIYLGNDLIINANREFGTTVIEPLSNFKKSQIRFIRILN